jgi:hypothetical protein
MDPRKHIDLLIFLVEQLFQLADLSFQQSHALFERLRVASRKSSATELVAGLALKADIGALCAARANAVAAYLLRAASVAGLCNAGLAARADLDNFHRQYSRHIGGVCFVRLSIGCALSLDSAAAAHRGITDRSCHKPSASDVSGAEQQALMWSLWQIFQSKYRSVKGVKRL